MGSGARWGRSWKGRSPSEGDAGRSSRALLLRNWMSIDGGRRSPVKFRQQREVGTLICKWTSFYLWVLGSQVSILFQ